MQNSILLVLLYSISSYAQLKLEYKISYSATPGNVEVIVFADDGKRFYSGDSRGYVIEWEVGKGQPTRQFKSLFGGITSLTLSDDGKMIASTAVDGSVYIWDLTTGENPRRFRAPSNPEIALNQQFFTAFSPDGEYIYFGGRNRFLCKAPVNRKEKPTIIYKNEDWDLKAGTFSSSGELVFAQGDQLKFIKDDEVQREIDCNDCIVNAFHYDKTGKYILTWCEDGKTRVWEEATGKLMFIREEGKAGPEISNLEFTVEDKYKVRGMGGFATWDVNHKGFLINEGNSEINFDFEDPENRWLASSDGNKDIQLWKIIDPKDEEEPKVVQEEKPEEPRIKEVLEVEKKLDPEMMAVVEEEEETQPEPVLIEEEDIIPQPVPKPEVVEKPAPKELPKPVIQKVTPPVVAKKEELPTPVDTLPKAYQLPERFQGRRVLPIKKENKLTFNEPNLTITVWDNKLLDGDIISLYLNDSLVLDNYSLDTIPKEIPIWVEKGKSTYLTLHAINLGTVPPNTADIIISDGKEEYQIELKSDFQGSSVAELKID